jgi:hypothetical protein
VCSANQCALSHRGNKRACLGFGFRPLLSYCWSRWLARLQHSHYASFATRPPLFIWAGCRYTQNAKCFWRKPMAFPSMPNNAIDPEPQITSSRLNSISIIYALRPAPSTWQIPTTVASRHESMANRRNLSWPTTPCGPFLSRKEMSHLYYRICLPD